MKIWIKPTIHVLDNAINSGQYTDGAERVLTCGGSVSSVGLGAFFNSSTVCFSNNSTGIYLCTGIVTINNGLIFVTSQAASITINRVCS